MNFRTVFFLALTAVAVRNLAADPETERILHAAQENSAALKSGDYSRLVDLTYPKLVEMMGGREKMIDFLKSGTDEMKKTGTSILGVQVTEPKQIVTSAGKQFAVVPMVVRTKIPEGTVRARGYLLAISSDSGKTWTFLDGSGITMDNLSQIVPDFPSRLSLPPKELPEVEGKAMR